MNKAISINFNNFEFVSDELKTNEKLILNTIRINASSYRWIEENIYYDDKFVMECIKTN